MRAGKMKFILLGILAVAVTIWAYINFSNLPEVAAPIIVGAGVAVAIYSLIEILF